MIDQLKAELTSLHNTIQSLQKSGESQETKTLRAEYQAKYQSYKNTQERVKESNNG